MPPTQLVTQALGLCFTADGLVMMVTMDGRQWTFPGGTVEDGESVRVAELRLRRGEVREELADYDGARDDHVAALELARALDDPRLEARALERLGWAALLRTRYRRHLRTRCPRQ